MAAPDELFLWEGDWGLPSVHTDCLTVLAYAQFAGAPLKLRKISNPWRCPGGSIPALRTNQKETLCRPSDIIIHLRKQKYNADYDLSAKEGADSLAFISLLEEKLKPALIYAFWADSKNYVDVTRRWFSDHMVFPLSLFLPGRMQNDQLEKLRLLRGEELLEPGEGLEKELFREATDCMNLLSQRLGSQKFFFGDSPSSLDAYVFGHLAPILKVKLPNGKLTSHLKSLDNLTAFCNNILLLYFPRDGRDWTNQKAAAPPSSDSDFDSVPNKRRKQFVSALFALGAMLGYALLTGIVSISHTHVYMHAAVSVPNKRRKQFVSALFALGAMLGYALLTGIVSISHTHVYMHAAVSVPNKRRKQFVSALFALGAMLGYALLTGIVSISHTHVYMHAAVSVPNKRRKQFVSALFALGAMLGYALLTGIVSISHTHEALEEPPDPQSMGDEQEEEEE